MIKTEELWNTFDKADLNFFTGVPDSTFKDWMKFLADNHGQGLSNIIACNECEAIAIAAGYYLATGKLGVVYMQNAGQGKTVNPLTSLCDPEVYSIPLIMMIGWRGEPGKKDEPQHKKMGRVMIPLLEVLEIPYKLMPTEIEDAKKTINGLKEIALEKKTPVALIIKKGSFEKYKAKKKQVTNYEMNREEAIRVIIDNLEGKEIIISTTGKTSRELFEYRVARKEVSRDFYTVGSMGCSASIALGIALQKKDKQVVVFDGDGAVIMQMGALATIGHYQPKNLMHIVFDNSTYDSTGGQPTVSTTVDFQKIALANGYKNSQIVSGKNELIKEIKNIQESEGPNMLIVKVNKGARKDLGRPTSTPIENKDSFMKFVSE